MSCFLAFLLQGRARVEELELHQCRRVCSVPASTSEVLLPAGLTCMGRGCHDQGQACVRPLVSRVNEFSGYAVGVVQPEFRQRAAAACGTSWGCRGTDFVAAGRPQ